MKCCLNPVFSVLSSFVEQLPQRFSHEGRVIYRARNEIRVFEQEGLQLNAKRYQVPIWINRLIYTFIRKSKAQRAYEYAFELKRRGFHTADPVAYLLFYQGGLLHRSYFVSLQLQAVPLYDWVKLSPDVAQERYRALGRFVGDLHEAGVYHADFSPGNVLYEVVDGNPRFYLIDINRMRFGNISFRKGCANFARLWGSEEAFAWMAESYAERRGFNPAETLQLVLRARTRFWKRYAKRHEMPFVC
ncbi:MAG: lipopolysaccharide kinase InaA family protein [Parabacteroides sp.]